MPVGTASGGQRNIYVWELVLRQQPRGERGEPTPDPIIRSIAIHPFLVAPTSISRQEASRSSIMQLTPGSIRVRGGRALTRWSFQGSFGVAERGFGAFLGTGDVRRRRFEAECIGLVDATTRVEIEALIGNVWNTPGIAGRLAGYDPRIGGTLHLNLYDLWDGRACEVLVTSYNPSRSFMRGSAAGLVPYSMTVSEVGPLVAPTKTEGTLADLLEASNVLRDAREIIDSYDPEAVVSSLLGPSLTVAATLASALAVVRSSLPTAESLLLLGRPAAPVVMQDFFGALADLREATAATSAEIQSTRQDEVDAPSGFITWEAVGGLGASSPALVAYDALAELDDLEAAALTWEVAGCFLGMGRESYRVWIESGGLTTSPETAGSTSYTVSDTDDAVSIEIALGATWAEILRLNRLTPDEALRAGTTLLIPRTVSVTAARIEGLPVFGSHIGEAAWGGDLALDLRASAAGDLEVVTGQEVLEQGLEVLLASFESEIGFGVDDVPAGGGATVAADRVRAILLTDRRLVGARSVVVSDDGSGSGLVVDADLVAINGASVRTVGA